MLNDQYQSKTIEPRQCLFGRVAVMVQWSFAPILDIEYIQWPGPPLEQSAEETGSFLPFLSSHQLCTRSFSGPLQRENKLSILCLLLVSFLQPHGLWWGYCSAVVCV